MALSLLQGAGITQSDPSPVGPTPLSNCKNVQVKVIRLTYANFTTGSTDVLGAVLPADAAIINVRQWVKTGLSGGSISAATISVGTSSGGTQIVNAVSAFGSTGANTVVASVNGMMAGNVLPQGGDVTLWVRGTATTGNPTAGEIYITIEFVR